MNRQKPTSNQILIIEACMNVGVPFFWRSPGTLLVEHWGVEEVVRYVVSEEVKLLGLEGFEIDSQIMPQLDRIASVESTVHMEEVLAIARTWDQSTWVDITLS